MRSLRDLMDLRGRVALITGGGGHIGASIAEALAELGAAIALLDMVEENCISVSRRVREAYGVRTLPMLIDLSDEDATRSVPARVLDLFGRLDVLVNCAALVGTSELRGWAVPFLEQASETWKLALEVNLTAPFVLTQACAQALKDSGHGSVINVSSIYGVVGPDLSLYGDSGRMGNPAAYAASKGGLLQLTRWLATVLAPDVRVNAITAGGVWRGQPEAFHARYVARTPLRRMAIEEDFKGAAAYLASDLSAYVTGQNVVVDGGWTAW